MSTYRGITRVHLSVLCILASALGFVCLSPMVDAIPFCNSVTQWPCLIDAFVPYFQYSLQIFVLRDYARETLSLRWRSWMTRYYIDRYLSNQTFYRIQSQSIIDNPDQRIVDDLSSFTGTALSFALTLFNAVIDLISFSNILFGIYPPLFVVLLVYSIGGTLISVYLGRVTSATHLANKHFPCYQWYLWQYEMMPILFQ